MKIELRKKEIDGMITEAIDTKKNELGKMVGELEDTHVEYPETSAEIEDGEPSTVDNEPKEDVKLVLPPDLVGDAKNLLDILINAKTVLSKLANHTRDESSTEMWSYHKKVEKVITDIQQKFKITH